MNSIIYFIALWFICALTRCLLFKKIDLIPWNSVIPAYGTYVLFKKIWSTDVAVIYIIATFAFMFTLVSTYSGNVTNMVLAITVTIMFIGWTGQAYYLANQLNESALNGILLALIFPVFSIVLGLKKVEEPEE